MFVFVYAHSLKFYTLESLEDIIAYEYYMLVCRLLDNNKPTNENKSNNNNANNERIRIYLIHLISMVSATKTTVAIALIHICVNCRMHICL